MCRIGTEAIARSGLSALGATGELAREGFIGTVAEFHARLDSMVSDAMRRSVRWPQAPNSLGNA
jgi:hypothetical protein